MSCTRAARAALGTMAGCWLLAAAPAGLGPAAGEPEVRTLLDWPLIFTQEPPAAAAGGREELRRTGGWAFTPGARGEGARLVRREPDGRLRVLTTGFSWAGEPAVSHDGHRLLFSGRRQPGEPRRIWEMSVEGGEARPVTGAELGDCGDPEYGSRNAINFPEFDQKVRWFVFTSDQPASLDLRLGTTARHLYVRSLEEAPGFGIVTWRTSYNPYSDLFPTFLADGRVLYSSFTHDPTAVDHGGGRFSLLAMSWEGVGPSEVHGAHQGPRLRAMPAEMPDRTVLFIESAGGEADGSGQLAEISWRRPLAGPRVLSTDGARYRDPRPLPDGRTLVARAEDGRSFGLWLFDRRLGQPAALVHDDPAWHDVDAVAVAPHPEPLGRIPAIWPGRFTTGDLHCMNVHESDLPGLRDVEPGTIRAVRFVEALLLGLPAAAAPGEASARPPYAPAAPVGATAALRTRLLGEVPVMPDGSFHVTLPADTPFTLQTLDAEGAAVGTMQSWLWLKPWYMHTCIGCHEDRELAPRNLVTLALQSTLLPVLGEATRQRTPDYVHDVRPILQARCGGSCHGPKLDVEARRPRLDGWSMPPYDRAYRTLVPQHVQPGAARASPLWRRLRGEGGRPPHAALLPAELRTLAAWIDLGAQWDATRYDIPVPVGQPPGPAGSGDTAAATSASAAAAAAAAAAAEAVPPGSGAGRAAGPAAAGAGPAAVGRRGAAAPSAR